MSFPLQHFLNFFPLTERQGSFSPIFLTLQGIYYPSRQAIWILPVSHDEAVAIRLQANTSFRVVPVFIF